MEKPRLKCSNCDKKSHAIAYLNAQELLILEEGCFQVTIKKNEVLIKEGFPAHHIYYVHNGFASLMKKSIGNKSFILSILKQGAFLGIQNITLKRKEYFFTAKALTEMEVCIIDIDIFEKLLLLNGAFASAVVSYLVHAEMHHYNRLINSLQQQLPGRLASTLLFFSREIYNNKHFDLNLTKTELASLVGTSRESISRLLKDFQDSGLIQMNKNNFTILNENQLSDISRKG